MLTSPPLTPSSNGTGFPLQPVKLLIQREDYATCHIRVPEEAQRLSAIALDGNFYSFFRALKDPAKALGLLLKLAARGNEVAMTLTSKGYVIWVHEPDGTLAVSANKTTPRVIAPTFGPADCWIIAERQPGYRACSLKVPDLPDTVVGIADSQQKLYSLYRREKSASDTLKLAARLSKRGDEVIILVRKEGYIVCIHEPAARMLPA